MNELVPIPIGDQQAQAIMATELAKTIENEVSPTVQNMYAQFDHIMGLGGVSAASLRGEATPGKHIAGLVRSFVDELPSFAEKAPAVVFSTEEPHEALAVRSATVFNERGVVPFYVVGLNTHRGERSALLAPAKMPARHEVNFQSQSNVDNYAGKLAIAPLSKRQLGKLEERLFVQNEVNAALQNPDNVAELFSRHTGKFEVHSSSAGRNTVKSVKDAFNYLSTDVAIQYGVSAHLARLAITFNKAKTFGELFGQQPPQLDQ